MSTLRMERADSSETLVPIYQSAGRHIPTTQKINPTPRRRGGPISKHIQSRREQKSWSWITTRPEARNDCAGEGRQQFNRPTVTYQKTVMLILNYRESHKSYVR
jgi:hypothetical protein